MQTLMCYKILLCLDGPIYLIEMIWSYFQCTDM